MLQLPVLDEQRESSEVVGVGDDHSLGAAVRDVQIRADRVGVVVDPRDAPGGHVLHVSVVGGSRLGAERRQDAEEGGEPGEQRLDVVLLRLFPEQVLQLLHLLRIAGRQVVCLGEVIGQVIQLDRVLIGVPDTGREPFQQLGIQPPRGPGHPHRQPPAVLVHRPVTEVLEVLLGVPLGSVRVGQRPGEGHARHGLLLDAVNVRGLRDPRDVQDRRPHVGHVGELRPQPAAVLDAGWPADDQRVARAAQMRSDLLAPPERRVPGPRPGGGVMRVHHLGAPGLQPAPLQRELHLLLIGQREPVDHRPLVERAGRGALQAGAVITPDPDHYRAIELAHLLDRGQKPADMVIGVLRIARVDLHLVREQPLAVLRQRVPGRHLRIPRGQFRVGRDHAEPLLPLEGFLAEPVPALVEPALVLRRPLLRNVMRRVAAPGRVVQEPRFRRIMAPHAMQPVDRLVGHRLREVERLPVLALHDPDELLVLGDHRVVLAGLRSQETPVIVKPPGVRPVAERAGRSLLPLRRQVPLADPRRGVAILLQDLRERRRVPRQHRGIPREGARELRDAAHTDRMMVTARQQRSPGGRAHRRHVEAVIAQPLRRHPVIVRGVDRAAERTGITEARIIDEHQQHVRSPGRRLHMADQLPVRLRVTQRLARHAGERRPADRQHTPVNPITHLSLPLVVCRSFLGTPCGPRVPSAPSAAPCITAFSP